MPKCKEYVYVYSLDEPTGLFVDVLVFNDDAVQGPWVGDIQSTALVDSG